MPLDIYCLPFVLGTPLPLPALPIVCQSQWPQPEFWGTVEISPEMSVIDATSTRLRDSHLLESCRFELSKARRAG